MSILDDVVKANRAPILFVGAGVSKRYLYNYPKWGELLERSFLKFEPDSFQFQKYLESCKRNGMTDFETNVYLGTVIENEFNNLL